MAPAAVGHQGHALEGYTVLYGGSFDPGHWGHVTAALALVRLHPDAVWLMPAAVHADKKNVTSFAQRLDQCRAVAQEVDQRLPEALRGKIEVTDVEGEVDSAGQTARVLEALRLRHPGRRFAFAMGSDCLAAAPKWAGWQRLQQLARVVVLNRPGYPAEHHDLLAAPMLDVSSTAVRRALAAGEAVDHLVPPAVVRLIAAEGLYQPAPPPSTPAPASAVFAAAAAAAAAAATPAPTQAALTLPPSRGGSLLPPLPTPPTAAPAPASTRALPPRSFGRWSAT